MIVRPLAACVTAYTTWYSGWMGIRIYRPVFCRCCKWRDRGNRYSRIMALRARSFGRRDIWTLRVTTSGWGLGPTMYGAPLGVYPEQRVACDGRRQSLRETLGLASEVPGHAHGNHDQKAGSGEAGGGY